MKKSGADTWNSGDPYEYFMGRWSSLMAPVFLHWLRCPPNQSWLDLGCGTGALSEAIFQHSHPAHLISVDPSAAFLEKARAKNSFQADLIVGTASEIPVADQSCDIVVSGLALNFFPDPDAALSEMKRVLKKDGTIGAYVWDYAGKMEFLRFFWDAAVALDQNATELDEGRRFPICHAGKLEEAFARAGFTDVKTTLLDIDTTFANFDDYWNPFLGGQGPAPGYLASLGKVEQAQLRNHLHQKLTPDSEGRIKLLARAIAIRGRGG